MKESVTGGSNPDGSTTENACQRVPPSQWVASRFAHLEGPLIAYTRRRLGGNLEIAREVVQEAFAKLCVQAWPDIEPQATAWLYKTCRHHAIDITRRNGRIAMIQMGNHVTTLHDRSQQVAERSAEQSDDLAAIRQQIEQLSEQQQEVLRLRLKDGLSYQQIADVTGLSASNVGYHLHQAVTTLRSKLRTNESQ